MQPSGVSSCADLFKPPYRSSLVAAFVLLGFAYAAEHFANVYAFAFLARPTSSSVGDLILDNVPLVDLSFIIIECALLSIVIGVFFVLSKPRYILFSLKALALFIVIRAISISLTHVGFYPSHLEPEFGFFDSIYSYLNFQLGFFFSGHTGLPFLMALIFWYEHPARLIFFVMSFVFGVAVLLAHIHYSIDVFAAPFMAYGIYHLARYLFPRDFALIGSTP